MIIRKIFEVGVNVCCGSLYSKMFHQKRQPSSLSPLLSLSFDVDDENDINNLPNVLKILKKHKIKSSFAIVGRLIEEYPAIHKQLIKDGHELINHTYSHPDTNFDKLSPEEIETEIIKCHKVGLDILGYKFRGFRIPHFGNQFTDKIYLILSKIGYDYSSSTIACKTKLGGQPYKEGECWEFPLTCCPKHPFCIFDSSHAFRSNFARHSPKNFLETFKKLLLLGIKNDMFLNIYLDPQDTHKFDFNKMLQMINDSKIYIVNYEDFE